MNTKQLTYFVKSAELGSIAAAARELDISQPSISQQISVLEHELKTTLFNRDVRGVCLTENGERFLAHARSILRQLDQAQSELHQSTAAPSGKVTLGFTQPICNILAVPLVTLIERQYPDIELSIYTGYSSDLIKMMKSGDIDLAVSSYDESDSKNIRYEKFFRENIYLLMGNRRFFPFDETHIRQGNIRFSELKQYEVMVTERTDSLGYMIEQYEKETGCFLHKRRPYGQLMTTLRYVTEGHGMLITPSSSFFHLEKNGEVNALDIIQPALYRDVFLVSSIDKPLTNAMAVIMTHIRTITRQENDKGHWRGCLV
ncbi:LysR family transcriptional regulator [Marinobacterium marinum]|uniref:LysR family transcriptional regulator n=1 Tax=Marinobacterium marinum TaxID=2756129 RepID=A0A7W2AC69_9GAMM|nr:LysR family transcriptional regulator [Marinobacterium marinum]MBA4502212.1 LysR family transcriptional regulator [Marinobacterium marinum]